MIFYKHTILFISNPNRKFGNNPNPKFGNNLNPKFGNNPWE